MKIRSKPVLVGVAAAVALVAVAAVVAYPAWSARQGNSATWVVESTATRVLDYDAEWLVVSGGDDGIAVLDRDTGATAASMVDTGTVRAALVRGRLVASSIGVLSMSVIGEGTQWRQQAVAEWHTLVAVTDEVAVSAVRVDGDYTLTGYALADGSPMWTVPNLSRVEYLDAEEPVRPPGALRAASLVSVQDATGWHLVAAATGVRVADTAGPVLVAGDAGVAATSLPCADVAIMGPPDKAKAVTWHDGPPEGECVSVWAADDRRILLAAPRTGTDLVGGEQVVRLYSLALDTGVATALDWRGTYLDLITPKAKNEIARSWGRYFVGKGAVYDTTTGRQRWHAGEAWLSGDTAVIAESVSGVDWLAPGVHGESRTVRVAAAATGAHTGDEFVTGGAVVDVGVLDRGQAVVFADGEAALLTVS